MTHALLVSCEHASNTVPENLMRLFLSAGDILETHRAYDTGALRIAEMIAVSFNVNLFAGTVSRLVVDLNRSTGNRSLFSPFTKNLGHDEKDAILAGYYYPYRQSIERHVMEMTRRRRVLHVSVHSFTPVLDGVGRNCDIGLLYDPSRVSERIICCNWKKLLNAEEYYVRANYPYRGVSDGITSWLRRQYPDKSYAGIELEINQKMFTGKEDDLVRLENALVSTLGAVCC